MNGRFWSRMTRNGLQQSQTFIVSNPDRFDRGCYGSEIGHDTFWVGQMRRRQFIGLIGGAAAWPLAARGQQKARYPTIGLVGSASTDDEETRRTFESACSEFGWVEGRNIHVVYRWAEPSQMRAVVAELVASAPDVIVANGTSVLTAVREATNSIPVVFVGISDP
jgi:putative ABC transport system substrate-binding protein